MSDTLIAVVSFNGLEETKRCIWSLNKQNPPVDYVLWDNASQDGTSQWINENADIIQHCVPSPQNVMWTPAVNMALKMFFDPQKHKFIGWMNNDIELIDYDTVRRLVGHLQAPHCGIVAPMMPRVGGPQEPNQYLETPMPTGGWIVVPYVLGAFCLMRSEVWQRVGFLDENMPLGADDHDYAIRVREAGYQCRVARDVYVDHGGHVSARTDIGNQAWENWGSKSWDSFNRKWENYYLNEEEAIKCHWGTVHHPGWDTGTGWLSPEEQERIWAMRRQLEGQ